MAYSLFACLPHTAVVPTACLKARDAIRPFGIHRPMNDTGVDGVNNLSLS